MKYANVIVDISQSSVDKTFQYLVPDDLQGVLQVGTPVRVPFGSRKIKGYVLELTDRVEYDESLMKPVESVIKKGVAIDTQLVRLAIWMKKTYGCTMNQALKTVLPSPSRVKAGKTKVPQTDLPTPGMAPPIRLNPEQQAAVEGILAEIGAATSAVNPKTAFAVSAVSAAPPAATPAVNPKTASVASPAVNSAVNPKVASVASPTVTPAVNPKAASAASPSHPRPCLLYGITGSGKTEVYMELIRHMMDQGKQCILLIPEISLTYQNLRRFYARFGDRVAVVNSRLSAGEKYEAFEKARRGEISLMIGPRSALFTPFPRLGMILVDEEHENAYNSDQAPRYRGVETAIARAQLAGAGVVLGSATPSMESFAAAMDRRYAIFTLRHRARAGSVLPRVHVTDLREELSAGNKSIFGRALTEAIRDRLEKKEQVILFLNRRGYSGFISCRSCGRVMKCPHCDVSLTSHRDGSLRCHYCGYRIPMPDRCPGCGSPYIAGFGIGTQKVESLTRKLFPEARTLRMDLDTTGRKDSHSRILSAFANGEADILIGTQMIVKGHDFPRVTLVGILAADLSLYTDDFRAAERTFQLLTQAAGRAGRAGSSGEVFIQTYTPENYAIETASRQDYISFYKQELVFRKMMHYPPCGEMLSLLITDPSEEAVAARAEEIAGEIRREFAREEPVIIGPSDAGVAKVQDIYRKRIFVKHEERQVLLDIRHYLEADGPGSVQADIL